MEYNEFEIQDKKLIKYNKIEGKTDVVVPDDIIEICNSAFSGNVNIRSIKLPESVENIGIGAFYKCYNLSSINIPKGVKSIEECAFAFCDELNNIVIPSSVSEIKEKTFYFCYELENIVLNEGITKISNEAFTGCEKLKKIIIPNTVKTISERAFYHCKNLKEITLPNSIEQIGDYAFDIYTVQHINLFSYKVFDLLDYYLKPVAVLDVLRNSENGKIKYTNEDMQAFIKYMEQNGEEILPFIIHDKELTHKILNVMKIKLITHEKLTKLITKINDIEMRVILLEYAKNFHLNSSEKNEGKKL